VSVLTALLRFAVVLVPPTPPAPSSATTRSYEALALTLELIGVAVQGPCAGNQSAVLGFDVQAPDAESASVAAAGSGLSPGLQALRAALAMPATWETALRENKSDPYMRRLLASTQPERRAALSAARTVLALLEGPALEAKLRLLRPLIGAQVAGKLESYAAVTARFELIAELRTELWASVAPLVTLYEYLRLKPDTRAPPPPERDLVPAPSRTVERVYASYMGYIEIFRKPEVPDSGSGPALASDDVDVDGEGDETGEPAAAAAADADADGDTSAAPAAAAAADPEALKAGAMAAGAPAAGPGPASDSGEYFERVVFPRGEAAGLLSILEKFQILQCVPCSRMCCLAVLTKRRVQFARARNGARERGVVPRGGDGHVRRVHAQAALRPPAHPPPAHPPLV
jgi:hypothetical protein